MSVCRTLLENVQSFGIHFQKNAQSVFHTYPNYVVSFPYISEVRTVSFPYMSIICTVSWCTLHDHVQSVGVHFTTTKFNSMLKFFWNYLPFFVLKIQNAQTPKILSFISTVIITLLNQLLSTYVRILQHRIFFYNSDLINM